MPTTAAALTNIITLSFLGALADSYGRRPMIILTCVGWIINFVLLWANATFLHRFVFVIAATVLRNCITSSDSATRAIIADITAPAARANAMALNYGASAFGMILGFAAGLAILSQDLTNYSVVWAAEGLGSLVLLGATYFLIIESRPQLERESSRR